MFHYQLVKRRKPLVAEPIIPSVKKVSKKYRSGSLIGKFVRHISEHKNVRKFFAGNIAALAIAGTLIPTTNATDFSTSQNTIIQSQNTLTTEKSVQDPLPFIKVNQGFSYFHPGIDFGSPIGTPIRPVKPGVVIEAGFTKDGYGNTVLISHGNGLESRYAHLSKIEVTVGEEVNMNTEIGLVGITGHSTGPHLHLEIHQNGKSVNPFALLPR